MHSLLLQEVTQENWREALNLTVQPEQYRFITQINAPIVLVALAKAYIRPNGLIWKPYIFYDETTMIAFAALVYEQGSVDNYILRHFFIDYRYQGKGYGKEALLTFIRHVKEKFPDCRELHLTVAPENIAAQRLYEMVGFQKNGMEDGEIAYTFPMIHENA